MRALYYRLSLRLVRAAAAIGELRGWRRGLLGFLAGILAATSLPPLFLLPLLWVSFPILFFLISGARSLRAAIADGWWFGFGYFLAGLYWISLSLLVESEKFAWMIPLALLLIPAVLACSIGIAAGVSYFAKQGLLRLLALAASWTLCEWARAHLLTGFPWNPIAVIWSWDPVFLQGLSVIGLYGLGFLTVLIFLWPVTFVLKSKRHALGVSFVFLGLIAACWIFGFVRLFEATEPGQGDLRLRIVQPNIPQDLKWNPRLRNQHLDKLVKLSKGAGNAGVKHIIWPETAIPFLLPPNANLSRILGDTIPLGGLLWAGSLTSIGSSGNPFKLFNSLLVVDASGEIRAKYDKHHLVPFGEYVPYRDFLGISKITRGRTDFSPGPKPTPIDLLGIQKVLPLICYEIIFSHEVAAASRADWVVNITNDAWFLDSAGPRQHFALAQMRAVELGLPVVRAANTGISGVIDPWGRVIDSLGVGVSGSIDVKLPSPLPATIYSQVGEWAVILVIFLVLLTAILFGHFGKLLPRNSQ